MRICSPQLGLSPDSSLGGTVYDREILKGLARTGVEVEILLPKGMPCEDIAGWRVHRTPKHWFYYYEYNWLFLFPLFRLWRNPGFDLLRVHSPTIGLLGGLFKRLSRSQIALAPYGPQSRGPDADCGPLGTSNRDLLRLRGGRVVAHYHHLEDDRVVDRINRLVIRSYDRITTDSRFCAEQLISTYGVERERVFVVYPGVDSKYRPLPASGALQERLAVQGRKVLFYLGNLKPRKNLLFLLDAFNEVRRQDPDARLIIAGGGVQEGQLRDRARALGLSDAVIFTGYIAEDDKVDYYNLADVFVLPSTLEGFGMVAAEAMACGKPAVVSNVCSLPEVVDDGQTGFLADPRDVNDFARKILRLLGDESLRRRMGAAGRAWVRSRFSWDAAAAKTKEVYAEALT